MAINAILYSEFCFCLQGYKMDDLLTSYVHLMVSSINNKGRK